MPEYRRFIAYFYEYIDRKKQGNAGFAKVELRNGMWRILFRLTAAVLPQPPLRVYGFVRENGQIAAFLLGKMPSGRESAQEWLYRADAPLGQGRYHLEDLAGIWIQSAEERCFISIWDEDPVDPGKFVLETAGGNPAKASAGTATEDVQAGNAGREAEAEENIQAEKDAEALQSEYGSLEKRNAEPVQPEHGSLEKRNAERIQPEHTRTEAETIEEAQEAEDCREAEYVQVKNTVREEKAAEVYRAEDNSCEAQETVRIPLEKTGRDENADREEALADAKEEAQAEHIGESAKKIRASETEEVQEAKRRQVMEEIFRKRIAFSPFPEQEGLQCVQIMPCDIVRLQQENYQVGRSSFLQHGFYQYRHLMLARTQEGTYLLGVPGYQNEQESYMARIFGFGDFYPARICECRRTFGYWCRPLARSQTKQQP